MEFALWLVKFSAFGVKGEGGNPERMLTVCLRLYNFFMGVTGEI